MAGGRVAEVVALLGTRRRGVGNHFLTEGRELNQGFAGCLRAPATLAGAVLHRGGARAFGVIDLHVVQRGIARDPDLVVTREPAPLHSVANLLSGDRLLAIRGEGGGEVDRPAVRSKEFLVALAHCLL